MPLIHRFGLVLLGACATIVVLGVMVNAWQHDAVSAQFDAHALDSAASVQRQVEDARRRELELATGILASSPSFVAYVSQSLDAQESSGVPVDVASIRDLLEERRAAFGFDAAAVLDPRGRVVASTGQVLHDDSDAARKMLVAAAQAGGNESPALIGEHGRPLLAMVVPLLRGTTVEALLLTGYAVDLGFAAPVASTGHVDVGVFGFGANGPALVASTLQVEQAAALLEYLKARPQMLRGSGLASAADGFDVDVGAGSTRATLRPLFGAERAGLIASIVPAGQRAVTDEAIRTPLLVGGGLLLIVILAIAAVVLRRIILPLAYLDGLSRRVAGGDLDIVVEPHASGALSWVIGAFNRVLSERRAYKQAIEQRRIDR